MTIENIPLSSIDVLTLIPQKPPFVMIDTLESVDGDDTVTTFTVRADNIFLEGDTLNACALIENIAQNCATRLGYINLINRNRVKLGFIGSIKNLRVLRRPRLGETLTTTVTVLESVLQLTMVSAVISVAGETIVTAEMKIALSDIDASPTPQQPNE